MASMPLRRILQVKKTSEKALHSHFYRVALKKYAFNIIF